MDLHPFLVLGYLDGDTRVVTHVLSAAHPHTIYSWSGETGSPHTFDVEVEAPNALVARTMVHNTPDPDPLDATTDPWGELL